jgi:hypothetical protein
MDTCTVEIGLLKKKPCGHAAVTHCLNCEQALCAQHAVPELSEAGKKTGKFVCKECKAALREIAKNQPPTALKRPVEPAKAAPAPAKAAPAPAKEGAAAPKPTDSGGIDYTPTKK